MMNSQSKTISHDSKLSINELKGEDNSLRNKIHEVGKRVPTDNRLRKTLIHDIDDFIGKVTKLSLREKKQNYQWLERSAIEWQEIFSEVFTIPRNFFSEFKLPQRPTEIISSRERQVIRYSQIKKDIATHAYYIGQDRKLFSFERKIAELKQNRNRIFGEFPSTPDEEQQDWLKARTYFASNVLSGKPDLVYQLNEESYKELEQVYLEDMKEIQAYHIWQQKGSPIAQNYLEACEQIRKRLLNKEIKTPEADFTELRLYLSKKYLTGPANSFPATSYGSESVQQLKQNKAQRIWEVLLKTGAASSPESDWKKAVEHAALYYDNIVGAIEGNKVCVKNVLKSFVEPWRSYRVVNCFEAAIAIYFIKPELIQDCCNNGMTLNDII